MHPQAMCVIKKKISAVPRIKNLCKKKKKELIITSLTDA